MNESIKKAIESLGEGEEISIEKKGGKLFVNGEPEGGLPIGNTPPDKDVADNLP